MLSKIVSRHFATFATLVLIVAVGHTFTLSAQTSAVGAAIGGTVNDSSGAPIAGVMVKLRNHDTNQTRIVTCDAQGTFQAEELTPGTYEVIIEQPGFAQYQRSGIDLSLGQRLRIDVALSLQSDSEALTVTAQLPAIDPSQTSVVYRVDGERIEELPVRSRNYLDFVLLAPGVSPAPPLASDGSAGALGASGFSFGGQRPRSNHISIDGLDNNDEYTGASLIELSPEIVQEFQVVNNGLSAESGGASGGSINVLTRSGTNAVHGDLFLFVQDGALNARDPLGAEPLKPALRRYRAGFALGGPIRKNRSFYYAAVEQEHNRAQSESGIDSTLASRINAFLETGADPNLSTRLITIGLFPVARAETEASGKLTHQITQATSGAIRYAFTNNKEASDAFGTSALVDRSARGSSRTSGQEIAGALTTFYGSQAVGDLRAEISTSRTNLYTDDIVGPEIVIVGLATFGRPYGGLSERKEDHDQGAYTYTYTNGKKTWKFGATVRYVGLRATVPDGFGGIYLFASLADFLAQQPTQFRQAFGSPDVRIPATSAGSFAELNWRVRPHVTVNFGTRYDFEHLPAPFREAPHDFSPRVALAWNPQPKLVLRTGYGIFFDRHVLANLGRAADKNGSLAYEQVADGALAASLFGAAGGGMLSSPAHGIAPSVYQADPQLATPYSQQASVGAEYVLSTNLTLRADFLFLRGVHLSRTLNSNLLPPTALTTTNAASLGLANATPQQLGRLMFRPTRTNPAFDDVYLLTDSASSNYRGMSLIVNRRMYEELEFSASYTLSKGSDDASEFDEQPQSPFDLSAERAASLVDQRHLLVLNALWDLPIGDDEDEQKSRPSAPPDWATRIFEHIEVAPILTIGSGRPQNPLTGVDSNLSHAFPLSARPLGSARNSLRTPATTNLDFRVVKYFPFSRSAHLDLVAESFNIFNHANISQVNTAFGSGINPLPSFGTPIDSTGGRRIQFSLDYEF